MVTKKCQACGKDIDVINSRKSRKYCSHACYALSKIGKPPANKDQVAYTCKVCNKVFFKSRSAKAKFCGRECYHKWHKEYMKENPSNPRNKIIRTCEWCKGEFWISPSALNRKDMRQGRFCSKKCTNAWKRTVRGKDHPLDKKITCTCDWCGKQYRTQRVYEGRTRFCSKPCHGAYTSHHAGRAETSIERSVRKLLESMSVEFAQEKKMGTFVCDFVIKASRLVIECDGVYWHSIPSVKERDARKDSWLQSHGYNVLRLTGDKIRKDLSWCKQQILNHL